MITASFFPLLKLWDRCEITDSAEKKARLCEGNRYNQKSTVDNIDTL